MRTFFNIDVLFSFFRVSQVPVVFILILLCFRSISILQKHELFYVALGFCFNLTYTLFGILSDRLFDVIRHVSINTKHVFSVISQESDLLASLCFLLAFITNYYFANSANPLNGVFKDFGRNTWREARLTIPFLVIFISLFFAMTLIASSFRFDEENGYLSGIIAVFDCLSLFLATSVFLRSPESYKTRRLLLVGFGIWSIIQLIPLSSPFIHINAIQLIGYSTSFFAKLFILLGFFFWYIEQAGALERIASSQRARLDEAEASSKALATILRTTYHEILLPFRSLDAAFEKINVVRFYRLMPGFDEVISNFERLKAIISVSMNEYLKGDSSGVDKDTLDVRPMYLNRRIVSINTLIEIAIKTIKASFTNFRPQVFYGANCYVSCNNTEIIQVFTNLMKNAIEAYGSDDHKEITVRTFNIRERENEKRKVVIEIEDRGRGIPADKRDIVWTDYSSKEPDLFNTVRGNGLRVAKQIIEQHEGSTIDFESPIKRRELGGENKLLQGTKFIIMFDRKDINNTKIQ